MSLCLTVVESKSTATVSNGAPADFCYLPVVKQEVDVVFVFFDEGWEHLEQLVRAVPTEFPNRHTVIGKRGVYVASVITEAVRVKAQATVRKVFLYGTRCGGPATVAYDEVVAAHEIHLSITSSKMLPMAFSISA